MNYQLKNKVDNSRKFLYFLRIGLAGGLHAVAAPRLLFKKGLSSSFLHKVTVLGYNQNLMESNC
jgi:hypothetical protein